jgi:polar amino acid transport system substrate-binding protein
MHTSCCFDAVSRHVTLPDAATRKGSERHKCWALVRHFKDACLSLFICLPLWTIAGEAGRQPILLRTAAQAATERKFIRLVERPGGEIEVAGLCVDIHRAIERVEPGIRFVGDQRLLPAIRVEAELMYGALDAGCGFSRTLEREDRLVFVGPPLFLVQYHLAVRADDDVAVRDWDDVRRLRKDEGILTTHGFGAVTRLRQVGGLHVDSGGVDAVNNMRIPGSR